MDLRIFAFLLVSIGLLTGCREEQSDKTEELILGRWEIQQAYRNGKTTESLEELYFEFYQDGKMKTNLLGASETASYDLEDGALLQRESRMDINYNIQELNDSILVMTTQLRDYDFRFRLRRSIQEE